MQSTTGSSVTIALGTAGGLLAGMYQTLNSSGTLLQTALTTAITATVSCLVSFLTQQALKKIKDKE